MRNARVLVHVAAPVRVPRARFVVTDIRSLPSRTPLPSTRSRLSLSLSLFLSLSPLVLGSSFSISRIGRLVLTRLIQMNRGLSDVSLDGLTGFSKLKRGGRAGGGPETSERPRFTGLCGSFLFLFCAPAPIRPRAFSSSSANARFVIVSAHARISSLLVLAGTPRESR